MGLLPKRLVVPWAILLALTVVCSLGLGVQDADYPTAFAPWHMYPLVAGGELFGLFALAPLALGGGTRRGGLVALALLWLMAAPVVVVAWWVSDCDLASAAVGQVYVLAAAVVVAGYLRVDAARRHRGVYWLLLAGLGAGAPVVAFVVGDLLHSPLTWLYAFSPFWVVARISQPWQFGWEWGAPFAAMLALGVVLHCWDGPRREARPRA